MELHNIPDWVVEDLYKRQVENRRQLPARRGAAREVCIRGTETRSAGEMCIRDRLSDEDAAKLLYGQLAHADDAQLQAAIRAIRQKIS